MPAWLIGLLVSGVKVLWGIIFKPKPQDDPAYIAGKNQAERDNAVQGLQEGQRAAQAAQSERGKLAADPDRLRGDTGVPGANRPYNPNEQD